MRAHELLALALAKPTKEELGDAIGAVVKTRQPEDQLLEFKDGKLASEKHFGDEVRKEICAFANAEGGVLIVGVAERVPSQQDPFSRADKLAGCKALKLEQKASHALQQLPGARSVIQVVEVTDPDDGSTHQVLAIAVPRSATLLRIWTDQTAKAYLRMGESSHPIPSYLELDLMLGRRERVGFKLSGSATIANHLQVARSQLTWDFTLANETLAWAPRIRVGLFAHGAFGSARGLPPIRATAPSDRVRAALDVRKSEHWKAMPSHPPEIWTATIEDVGPLDTPSFQFALMTPMGQHEWCWTAAFFAVAPNSDEHWFSLRLAYNGDTVKSCEVIRLHSARPIVFFGPRGNWLGIPEAERDAV